MFCENCIYNLIEKILKNSDLTTMDVKRLYTKTDHEEGGKICSVVKLENRENKDTSLFLLKKNDVYVEI